MYSSMWRGSGNGGGGSVDYSRVVEKIAVIPSAETATVGKVYMYMGESNATYTHGYIYECVATQTATAVSFSGNIVSNWAVADFVSYLQEGGSAYNEVTHGTLTYDATGNLWDLVGYDANGIQVMIFHEYTEDLEDFGCVFTSSTHQDGDNCTFTMTTTESGKKWKRLDVQPAGGSGGGAVDSVNGKTGVVVLDATDVNALPDSTKYVASATWSIDSSTYIMTLQLKDQDGANIGSAQTIDLPLESVVVGGSYDSTNKKIVLTLNNGTTIDVPVADLVSGLQSEITAQSPLSADLVDDTNATHKFVSAAEKSTWNGKQDAISDLATIRSGAEAGATAVQPGDLATVATTGQYSDLIGKPTIPAAQVNSDWNANSGVAQILNKPTLGTAASANTTDFATSAQGAKADTAVQPSAIADMETQTHAGATYATKAELADKQDIIQYSTMPTASADNVGDIVQFVGTTTASYTNGYFYKCVSDGGTPATYSWTQVNVQPQGDSLPSQSGQNGKFLTTNGTNASWAVISALTNNTTQSYSLAILGNAYNSDSVAVGDGSTAYYAETIVIGSSCSAYSAGGIAIGYSAGTFEENANRFIAIGHRANVGSGAKGAIQIGSGTNSTAGTMAIGLTTDGSTYTNYELLSANGTIPTDRFTTSPVADGTYVPTLTISSGTATRSWGAPASGLPSQSGHSGEFLTTDGTDASWGAPTVATFRVWGANE